MFNRAVDTDVVLDVCTPSGHVDSKVKYEQNSYMKPLQEGRIFTDKNFVFNQFVLKKNMVLYIIICMIIFRFNTLFNIIFFILCRYYTNSCNKRFNVVLMNVLKHLFSLNTGNIVSEICTNNL